jgi:membrane-bound serine protease (ClpP class)
MRLLRRAVALVAMLLPLVALPAVSVAAADQMTGAVVELRAEGVVDPFMADYLVGGIDDAAASSAAAVLITIDTPGGLGSSMREITQAILNADVPVIGYVYPPGARAASAGTFILLATNIAAMAPGTNVGAAHPVGLSGAIESEKATNDAAASIRSIAQQRDRNAEWAEQAVRDSVSASAQEALDLGVIDLIAPDVATLLRDVDGMAVEVAGGQTVTLDTAGAPVVEEQMRFVPKFFHALLNPDLAFIFFWLGLALLVLELFVPGGIAGTVGALMLVGSFVALGMLPVQLIGIVLLIASVVFFVLELKHPGIGVPAIAGVVCLALGGWFLFGETARVSPLLIVPVALGATAFFLIVVRAAIRMRRSAVEMRDESLVGQEGVVVNDCAPVGVVKISSEEWSAEAVGPSLVRGDRVRVVAMEGLKLKIEPLGAPDPAVPSGDGGRNP